MWQSIRYTSTPVTETYNQRGNVTLAILGCWLKLPVAAKQTVVRTSGKTTIESEMCVIKIKKYNGRIQPSP